MPLIDSTRLSDEDRAAWAVLAPRYREPRWRVDERAFRAQRRILDYLRVAPGHVCVSWGKDSVVLAHLARCVIDMPVVWVRLGGAENPECFAVRDAYLSGWPCNYLEVVEPVEWDSDGEMCEAPWSCAIRRADRECGARRVMGIRAAESSVRTLSARIHGVATSTTCRPLLDWTTAEVLGYLLAHDLPISAVYAMSYGGRLDLERLRTDFLGDTPGRDRGRREWERHYFGDLAPYSVPDARV